MGSNFDVKDDLVLALRSQYFEYLREKNTDMPWSWCTLNRFVQKKMVSSNGNACPLLTFLKACGRRGHVLATRASAMSCTKLGPLPLFMVVSMILLNNYVSFE